MHCPLFQLPVVITEDLGLSRSIDPPDGFPLAVLVESPSFSFRESRCQLPPDQSRGAILLEC